MIFFAVLLAGGTPALACDDPQTQTALTFCALRDFERADAALNAQWPKNVASMKESDKSGYAPKDGGPTFYAALLESQRAWLRYRDTHCRVEGYQMRGGTAEPMNFHACRATLTRARTQQLKDLEQGY